MKHTYKFITKSPNPSQDYYLACDAWYAGGRIGPEPDPEAFKKDLVCVCQGCYLEDGEVHLLLIVEDSCEIITRKVSECKAIKLLG